MIKDILTLPEKKKTELLYFFTKITPQNVRKQMQCSNLLNSTKVQAITYCVSSLCFFYNLT